MSYTKYHDPWVNADAATGGGDESTPLVAAALDHIEAGIAAAATVADAAIADVSHVTNGPLYWNGSAWVSDTLKNAQIASNAAIAVSKLAAGSEGDVLKTVGGTPAWAQPSTILIAAMPLDSVTATTASLAGYNSLRVLIRGRSTSGTGALSHYMRFNSDSGSNYSNQVVYANASTAGGNATSAVTAADIGVIGGTSDTSVYNIVTIDIVGHALTGGYKSYMSVSHVAPVRATTTGYWVQVRAGEWYNTGAITSLSFLPASGAYAAGSWAWVYGIT